MPRKSVNSDSTNPTPLGPRGVQPISRSSQPITEVPQIPPLLGSHLIPEVPQDKSTTMPESMALKDMPEDVTHPKHPLYAMFGRPWEANAIRSGLKTYTEQGHDPMDPPFLGPRWGQRTPEVPHRTNRPPTSTTNRPLVHSARGRPTDPRVLNSGNAAVERNQMVMIPVAICDASKINEIVESMMIVRNLEQTQRIKQLRSKLSHIHNCPHCMGFNLVYEDL